MERTRSEGRKLAAAQLSGKSLNHLYYTLFIVVWLLINTVNLEFYIT